MKKYDCDVCQSAGSVNQWGYCEICGEEFEEPGSMIGFPQVEEMAPEVAVPAGAIFSIGQDAA